MVKFLLIVAQVARDVHGILIISRWWSILLYTLRISNNFIYFSPQYKVTNICAYFSYFHCIMSYGIPVCIAKTSDSNITNKIEKSKKNKVVKSNVRRVRFFSNFFSVSRVFLRRYM